MEHIREDLRKILQMDRYEFDEWYEFREKTVKELMHNAESLRFNASFYYP